MATACGIGRVTHAVLVLRGVTLGVHHSLDTAGHAANEVFECAGWQGEPRCVQDVKQLLLILWPVVFGVVVDDLPQILNWVEV